MEGIVAQGGHLPVHGHQLLHVGDLAREDDPVVGEPRLLCQGCGAHGALHHGVPEYGPGGLGIRAPGVLVHEVRQETLVQGTPVDPDPHRLAVVHGHPHDGLEVLVPPGGAHVAGVDAVLGEGPGSLGIPGEEDVTVVVEVPDNGCVDSFVGQAGHDLRDRLRRFLVIHGDPDQLAPGQGQGLDLVYGCDNVGCVGVGHGLDHHRVRAPDSHATHGDFHGLSATHHAHERLLTVPLRLRPRFAGRLMNCLLPSDVGRGQDL